MNIATDGDAPLLSDPDPDLWRTVWRKGIVPQLSDTDMENLRHALEIDDPRILQGKTTSPPPRNDNWPIEAACPLGFVGALQLGGFLHDYAPDGTIVLPAREHPARVAAVEGYFAALCSRVDDRLGVTFACRWFLNAVDEWPRDQMRRELLAEVNLALGRRSDG